VNRLISGVLLSVLTAVGMAVAGYFQERGFVAIGDARVPSSPIAWISTVFTGILGLAGGGAVPWKTWVSKLWSKVTSKLSEATSRTEVSPMVDPNAFYQASDERPVDWVPAKVAHIDRCIYHLRCVLSADPEAQDFIDKIAVKVGRITSNAAVAKSVVKETEVAS
jgi:hypothetical protein